MSDFRLNVIAETQAAERKLQQVEKLADTAVKPRKLNIDVGTINKSFSDIKTSVEGAANSISQFYKISRNLPVIGAGIKTTEETVKNLAKSTADLATAAPGATVGMVKASSAGSILSRSLKTAASSTDALITKFARLGLSLYAIKESTNILKAAFGGLFGETVGRAARFQETLLKTQTTLASTNRVFRGDTEITDPLEKVLALQGAIEERVKSIRDRSIDLAGVTSNEVVEVFGIVASQIGQVGGGLKEAEDLAINFAAALGTFGIPLYQARQEVGSILRGDITVDSYLARALGITNEDIARAKTEAGGVIKFIEKSLAGAVAGQTIAAKGLSGVLSNIRDIAEIVSQAIGEPLLDPIIAASTALYNVLFSAKDTLADIGTTIGKIFSDLGKRFTSAFQLGDTGEISLLNVFTKQAPIVFATIKRDLTGINNLVGETITRLGAAFRELFTSLTAMSATTVKAFRELLDAFIQLQLVSFESLISAIATLAQGLTPVVVALTKVLEGWAGILRLPIVQFFAQIGITFAVLQKTGVIAIAAIITQLAIWSVSWKAIVAKVTAGGALIQGVIKSISVSLGSLLLLLGQAAASLKTLFVSQSASPTVIKNITELESQLNKAGRNAKGLAYNFRNLGAGINTLGRSLGTLALNVIKANAAIIAVTVGITLLVDAYGRWKRAQEEARQALRDTQVINNYVGSVQYLNRELTVAEQKLKDAALAAADKRYSEATERIVELREELEKLRKELDKDQARREGSSSARKIRLTPREDIAFETYGERRRKRRLIELEKEIMAERKKESDALAVLEEERAKDAVRTAAQNRTNLEKEIGELRRQLDNDLFQQRQNLAQKEVDIFRAAGELRIQQMERANAKLIEGEEGASRAALESLNNYISTRERGELEIEAAKKTLAIEVANLEKSIADYQLDIAKKIAEIQKKSADYQRDSADAQQRAASGTTAAAPGVSAGFRVGSTGSRSTGPHLDIRSPTGNKQAVVNEALSIIKAWQQQGIEYIELSNAKIDVKNMFDEAQLRAALVKEQTAHGLRSGGGAIDIAVPSGTLVPTPAGTPSWGEAGGWQATSLNTGNVFLHGLGASVASPGGARAAAPAAPTAPAAAGGGLPDAGAAADRYAAAVRGVAGAMEHLRSQQAALTRANTAEAFEKIAKDAFPTVALEEYDNQAIELIGTLDVLRGISTELYDPERIRIAVEQKAKELIAERERSQILTTAGKRLKEGKITQAEFDKLTAQLAERQKNYVADLAKEATARKRNLEFAKQQNAVESLKRATGAIRFDVQRAGVQAQATMAQAFVGDNSAALRSIEAEQRIAEERIRLEQDATKTTEDITRELTAFAEKTRSAATELGAMDEQVKRFAAQMGAIREASRAITDGYKGLAQSFLSGGDLKEAVGQMSRSITDKLTGMFLDTAFKPMEDLFVKTLQDVFGMQDPTKALQEQNNRNLDLNTKAIEANTLALQKGPTSIPVTPFAGYTKAQLESMDPTAMEHTLEQSFQGIGSSLTELGTVADTTGKQTGDAAATGEKGFGKFLGAMTGVATGALAITGAIQAMQQSESGTYGTLMGIAGVLGGLGSVFGGFAALGKKAGGPVAARRPYIVGEIGPELFVPDGSGTIVPNDKLAFSGSKGAAALEAESSASSAFSSLYGAQIPFTKTTERLMSERSERETVAAINNPKPLDVRFESSVINGVEYVTAEQHQRGMAQAAERGRTLTLEALQNSVTSRRKVGIA